MAGQGGSKGRAGTVRANYFFKSKCRRLPAFAFLGWASSSEAGEGAIFDLQPVCWLVFRFQAGELISARFPEVSRGWLELQAEDNLHQFAIVPLPLPRAGSGSMR